MKRKTVLITGGLGFIGSNLYKKFLNNGYDVIIIDNLANNVILPTSLPNESVYFVEKDIRDVKAYELPKIDLIIHLASPIGTVSILKNAGFIAKEILDATYSVLDLAIAKNARLVFASTCEIYGDIENKGSKINEDYYSVYESKHKVREEYSIAKKLSESIIKSFSKKYKEFSFAIFRPFNIVGVNQKMEGGHVLPRFVHQSKNSYPITVYGDGKQKRSFTAVEDASEAIFLISESKLNDTWNIGNLKNQISIIGLALKIKDISKTSSEIEFVNPKEIHGDMFEDVVEKVPDASKLLKDFGWKPTKNVDDIILDLFNETE